MATSARIYVGMILSIRKTCQSGISITKIWFFHSKQINCNSTLASSSAHAWRSSCIISIVIAVIVIDVVVIVAFCCHSCCFSNNCAATVLLLLCSLYSIRAVLMMLARHISQHSWFLSAFLILFSTIHLTMGKFLMVPLKRK